MKTLLIANPKGGVGKSLVSILAVEWFLAHGFRVGVEDADQNQNTLDWMAFCKQKGREIGRETSPELMVIDTAGLSGALRPFMAKADLILTPFKGLTPDIARLIRRWWFSDLTEEDKAKLYFVPNMMRVTQPTKDQVIAYETLERLLQKEGKEGHLLPGLALREAIYGRVFNGSSTNFFQQNPAVNPSLRHAQEEAHALFSRVKDLLGLKK